MITATASAPIARGLPYRGTVAATGYDAAPFPAGSVLVAQLRDYPGAPQVRAEVTSGAGITWVDESTVEVAFTAAQTGSIRNSHAVIDFVRVEPEPDVYTYVRCTFTVYAAATVGYGQVSLQSVAVPLLASTAMVYPPTLNTGQASVTVPFMPSTGDVFNPSVGLQGGTISVPLIAATGSVFTPTFNAVFAINTPILFEGDSNTSFTYRVNSWSKRALARAGGRYWVPPGGWFAAAGAGIRTAAYGSNSMESRQAAVVAKIEEMVARYGECVVYFQIGTNNSPDVAADITTLNGIIAAYKAAGATVLANGAFYVPPSSYVNTLNAALYANPDLDGFVDTFATIDVSGRTEVETHYNDLEDGQIGQAAGDLLLSLITASDIYTDAQANLVTNGTLAGTAGTNGAGTSGQVADGWTVERVVGDGTITNSKTTLGGKTAQKILVTAGAANTFVRMNRSVSRSMAVGDVIDTWATVDFSDVTDASTILHAGLTANGGMFPFNVISPVQPANWTLPSVWRTYPVTDPDGGSTYTVEFGFQVAAGKTAAVILADIRSVLRDTVAMSQTITVPLLAAAGTVYSPSVGSLQALIVPFIAATGSVPNPTVANAAAGAPVNTVAPVVTGTGYVGQTLTTTNGSWSNAPTGYTYQWQRSGVDISGATSSTYVVTLTDEGAPVRCVVTATNGSGSTAANSNAIEQWIPTDYAGGLSAWWDAATPSTITQTGGAVSAWASRVGSITASQGNASRQPTYSPTGHDSRPAITPDGTDDYLEFPHTSFPTGSSESAILAAYVYTSGGVANRTLASYGQQTGTFFPRALATPEGYARAVTMTPAFTTISSSLNTAQVDLNTIAAAVFRATEIQIFRNNVAGTAAAAAMDTAVNASYTGSIFARHTFYNEPFTGHLKELIFSIGTLSTDDRRRFEGYFAHRWNMTDRLDAGHPHKTVAPTP